MAMDKETAFLEASLIKKGDTVYVDSRCLPFEFGDELEREQIPANVDWVERVNDAIVGKAVDISIQIGGNEKVLVIPLKTKVLIRPRPNA